VEFPDRTSDARKARPVPDATGGAYLRHSCGSKTLESPLFESFLAQNQWSNRRPGQADLGELSGQGLSVTGAEPIIPQTWSSTAPRRLSPFPPTSPRSLAITVTDSYGPMDPPRITLTIKWLTFG
jgi:hypothetical protein